jgi:hypothetical protein
MAGIAGRDNPARLATPQDACEYANKSLVYLS